MSQYDGYFEIQVKKLKDKSNSELCKLIEEFSKFLDSHEHKEFANYLSHVKREYAERVGRK